MQRLAYAVTAAAMIWAAPLTGPPQPSAPVPSEPSNCGDCHGCNEGWGHHAHLVIPGTYGNGIPHTCYSSVSGCPHPTCGSALGPTASPEDNTVYFALLDDAVEGSRHSRLQLVTHYPDQSLLNVSRRALQLLGCGGRLAAHISLDDDELGTLQAQRTAVQLAVH